MDNARVMLTPETLAEWIETVDLSAIDLFPFSEDPDVERNRGWRREFVAASLQDIWFTLHPPEEETEEAVEDGGEPMVALGGAVEDEEFDDNADYDVDYESDDSDDSDDC